MVGEWFDHVGPGGAPLLRRAALLQAVAKSAADFEMSLVHASASELCRLFARRAVRPLLLADDRPDSVTHAYAAMKLMSSRAGFMVYELLLGAADSSPRAERIVERLASCADGFLGAVLRDYAHMNLKEIAAVLKVTESRVCQLHSQSIARLRVKLREW